MLPNVKFAKSNKGSRSCVNNIAITLICIMAVAVGQGCASLSNVKEIDFSITGFEAEFYEPVVIPDGKEYRK